MRGADDLETDHPPSPLLTKGASRAKHAIVPPPQSQQQWPIPNLSYVAGYPTKSLEDYFIYRYVNSDTITSRPNPPEFGERHPENTKYPEHVLTFIKPDETVGVGWMLLIYCKNFTDQDDWNFDVSYPLGSERFPRIEREYILRREEWLRDGPLALGTADPQLDVADNPVFPDATLIESDQLTEQTGDPRIDSLFVRVKRVFEHIPDLSDSDDATAAHGFGYTISTPFGRTQWPRIVWRIPNTSQTLGAPLSDICPIVGYTGGTFGDTTSLTGGATNGTTAVTVASTARLYPGAKITGTDIPANTTVVNITSATAFVISTAATGTHSSLTFTIGQYLRLIDQSYENDKGEIVALTRIYEPVYGPLIPESDLDQTTFTAVRTTKQIVAQSAVPATPALLTAEMAAAGNGVTIEYKPMGNDGLRSVRLVSYADVSSLEWIPGNSKDIITYGTHIYHYWPDVLVAVALLRQESAAMSASIAMATKIRDSWKGPCFARFTERYTSDPTAAAFIAAFPNVHSWFAYAQTIIAGFASVTLTGNPITDSRVWTIPATIHPDIPVEQVGSSTFYDGGYYSSLLNATPYTALPAPGEWMCAELGKPERVAHRLWKYTFTEVQYPEEPV